MSINLLTQCATSKYHTQEQQACFVPGIHLAPRDLVHKAQAAPVLSLLGFLLGQKPNTTLQLLTDHPDIKRESGQQGTFREPEACAEAQKDDGR